MQGKDTWPQNQPGLGSILVRSEYVARQRRKSKLVPPVMSGHTYKTCKDRQETESLTGFGPALACEDCGWGRQPPAAGTAGDEAFQEFAGSVLAPWTVAVQAGLD